MTNPLCHWDLMVNDVEKAKRFYGAVFGWKFTTQQADYTMIETGTPPSGGLMAKPLTAPMPALNSYFQVDDIAKTLRAAVEHGATVVVPKTPIANYGWFAMFLDPERIPIGVWEKPAN